YDALKSEFSDLMSKGEVDQINAVQDGIVNFYAADAVNPYIAISARGSWIITTCGAVLHDSGGYGMLGLGHSPKIVMDAMNSTHVMANIMTPSYSQLRLMKRLDKEIGHRGNGNPYKKIICMNSGSESVTVAARISDIKAANLTEKGGKHEGKTIKVLAFKGGFHGRTDRPAQFSDSTIPKYKEHLASFKGRENLVTIEPNSIDELKAAFEQAKKDNVYFEAFFMEPVMGEGNPGMPLDPGFYKEARKITKEMGTLLLVDSIQAGLRAHGCLSVVDYPGFEGLEAPDMETFSKAMNAGQYPLSVLGMTEETSKLYIRGVYGNTMTANPRAIEVACAVFDNITPEFRKNVKDRGDEFVEKLSALSAKYPDIITKVQGTGLLFSAEISSDYFDVVGPDGLELYMRKHGLGVVHGGVNSLRFTPVFDITSAEVDMMVEGVEQAILNAPRKK
ncbi:aminotransferase class III-fold pyridoxal phosphate-dependent enzyme, partial [bacterium]|nr:aminotransferase class III-fold pyridoxal phosphate-dependent enzyme [bacterium]